MTAALFRIVSSIQSDGMATLFAPHMHPSSVRLTVLRRIHTAEVKLTVPRAVPRAAGRVTDWPLVPDPVSSIIELEKVGNPDVPVAVPWKPRVLQSCACIVTRGQPAVFCIAGHTSSWRHTLTVVLPTVSLKAYQPTIAAFTGCS